ncbi:hypothetical protein A3Q56_07622, partial [Intoshia linei]
RPQQNGQNNNGPQQNGQNNNRFQQNGQNNNGSQDNTSIPNFFDLEMVCFVKMYIVTTSGDSPNRATPAKPELIFFEKLEKY